jgi:hypothetical protein
VKRDNDPRPVPNTSFETLIDAGSLFIEDNSSACAFVIDIQGIWMDPTKKRWTVVETILSDDPVQNDEQGRLWSNREVHLARNRVLELQSSIRQKRPGWTCAHPGQQHRHA